MMDFFSLLAFATAMFVLAITPGPGVLAVTTRSISAGFGNALILSVGILFGDIVYLLFAIYGLSALANSLYGLFAVIRYAGSAYLIWLGISLIRTRAESVNVTDFIPGKRSPQSFTLRSCGVSLLSGFSITLGNPKVIFFYLSFLPTFMDLTLLTHADALIICITAFTVSICVLFTYAFLADRSRRLFTHARARVRLNRTAGCVLTATGIALAAD